jgi:hypothetical protein
MSVARFAKAFFWKRSANVLGIVVVDMVASSLAKPV